VCACVLHGGWAISVVVLVLRGKSEESLRVTAGRVRAVEA